MDAALEMDGEAEKVAGGKQHGAAASGRAGLYGAVDGQGVQRLAVALGAIIADIEERSAGRRGLRWLNCLCGPGTQQGQTKSTTFDHGAATGCQLCHAHSSGQKRTAWTGAQAGSCVLPGEYRENPYAAQRRDVRFSPAGAAGTG